ncbi:adenosylcobinamide-GDP ribazoletransferase [Acetobacter sp.]|uniref:adenosylcobinamide-GDP ribazoletransferase n=1 Tax=Acetobacter sp. TaxID=440 RepID=UPI0025BE42EF|nr:adenosylcobinamide-GDP ribazoletransferase [Acetobacter sp.]MCI1298421.1 adenosylcobinamide-GDP ribazoletransferase [Acetobacter sp.]
MADHRRTSILGCLAADFLAALGLFTRLPLQWLEKHAAGVDLRRSVRVWPLTGGLIGALTACAMWLGYAVHLPPAVSAICAVMMQLLVTGGLHEDGLADSADGMVGGRTVERRLEIMRDSRIGSYGTLALCSVVALRCACIASLPVSCLFPSLILAGSLSRAAILLELKWGKPARQDGLASALFPLSSRPFAAALLTTLLLAVLLIPANEIITSFAAALLTTTLTHRFSIKKIGGFTGDILGAEAVLAELAVLVTLTSFNG